MMTDDFSNSSDIDWEDPMLADRHEGKEAVAAAESSRPAVIVRPVVNAIRIMRLLASAGTAQTAAWIAATLGINRSTCFNILKTLADEHAIEFDRGTKTYSMAMGHQRWQAGLISEEQRLAAARRLMRSLSGQYSVTVSLWKRLRPDRLALVAVEHSPSAIRIHMMEGQRVPILMGSSGRVLAAQLGLSKKAIHEGFKKLRWQQPISFKDYMAGVERAREQGYGVDEGHFARGVTSIGVAVLDRDDQPRFSATAVMFQGQYDDETVETIGIAMLTLGHELAEILT